MQALAEQLKQAHIKHIMGKLQASERELAQHFAQHIFTWGEKQTLNALLDESSICSVVEHIASLEPSDAMQARLSAIIKQTLALDSLKQPLGEILDEHATQRVVVEALALEEARSALIHSFIDNKMFSHILTDILYNGIKSYLTSDSGIGNKIPGMSSMLKVGKWASSKAGPGIEQSIDKTIKSYLNSNIQNSVKFTEKLINDMLNPQSAEKIFKDIWGQIKDKNIAQITQHIKEGDHEKIASALISAWNDSRTNPAIVTAISQAIIKNSQALEGNINALFADIGIDQHWLTQLAEYLLVSLTRNPIAMQQVENWLAEELASFYQSQECLTLLERA